MKWLKLDCDFRNDPKILSLIQRFGGKEAVSFWVLLLSYMGAHGMPNCEIRVVENGPHSINLLSAFLCTKPKVALTMLSACAHLGLISPERWENDTVISIPKMLKRLDDYSRKVRTLSTKSPKNPQLEEEEDKEPPIVPPPGDEKEPESGSPYSPDFETFWTAYPRKEAKGAAWTAWKRLRPNHPLQAQMLEAVGRHRDSAKWHEENGRFIPHPATWINKRRWEDSPEAPQKGYRPKGVAL